MKKYLLTYIFVVLISHATVYASTIGNISSSHYSAYVCHDTTCTDHSSINFLPSGGASPVTITSAVITGYAWGNDLGWINFAPSGSGVTYDSVTGNLSGYAWSSTSGWVNFRPSNAGTVSLGIPVGVTIQSDGSWYGWAFATGKAGGWIKFDCSVSETCVKVIWNTTTVTSSGGGGGYFVSAPTPKMEVATTSQNSTSTISDQGLKVIPTIVKNIKKVIAKSNVLSVSGGSSYGNIEVSTGKSKNSINQVASQKTVVIATSTRADEIKNAQLVATSSTVASLSTKNYTQENKISFISKITTFIKKIFSWIF